MFKIAVCDDEEIEVQCIVHLISAYINEQGLVYRIDTFKDGLELLESDTRYDVIFLDISMKKSNGIEVGQNIYRKNRQTKIIYITSFREYCYQAMNHVHAFAYLTKPIDRQELNHQLEEILREAGEEKKRSVEIEFLNVYDITDMGRRHYMTLSIPVADILYLEYVKAERKVHIKTTKQTIVYNATMSEAEEKMKPYGFGVCYRGIIVNYGYVINAKKDMIYLSNGEQLPLSKRRSISFKQEFNEYIHRSIS